MKGRESKFWTGALLGAWLLMLAAAAPLYSAPADVRSALTLIRQWQLEQTSYHLRMDIAGQFIQQESHLYCYPVAGGGRVWKLDNRLMKPNEARMIFEEAPGDLVAYFPETQQHVLTKALPGYADILAASFIGLTDEDRTLEKTKASSLISVGPLNALTLVFDSGKLGINPPKQDIRITIRFDNTGKLLEVEQRRLGLTQVAKLTYLTFNIDEVRARMPVTPDPALANPAIPFQDALEESIIHFAKIKQIQRNRL